MFQTFDAFGETPKAAGEDARATQTNCKDTDERPLRDFH
jgi:hypothetical protein